MVFKSDNEKTHGAEFPEPTAKEEPADQLKIELIEGPEGCAHRAYLITSNGYSESLRKTNDGCVYFGAKEKNETTGEILNDVVISSKELGLGQKHFLIKYVPELKSYFIKDMGEGTGTFVKIVAPLELMSGYIISFGENHMIIGILWNIPFYRKASSTTPTSSQKGVQDDSPDKTLSLRFLDGVKHDQDFVFKKQKQSVILGRIPDCDVFLDDSALSRHQCSINFVNEKWILEDGNNKKTSTNGTWIFAEEFYPITDGLIFKAGQSIYRISIVA